MNKRPDRFSFSSQRYKDKLIEDPQDENALNMLEFYEGAKQQRLEMEQDSEWQHNNMEYDLRTSEYIIEKCKDHIYAQHLYAAMCNNEFTKNDVWPLLKEETWSCSWRYAGGIIADIRQEGDYIDWYCSGIRSHASLTEEELSNLTEYEKTQYFELEAYVSESIVTDEIRDDLFKLGWLVMDDPNDNF